MTTTLSTMTAFDKAMDRAFFYMPEVVWLGGDEYAVASTSNLNTTYHVILTDGFKLTGEESCTCEAGLNGYPACVHRARALIEKIAQEGRHDLGRPLAEPAAPELTLLWQETLMCVRCGLHPVADDDYVFCDDCGLEDLLEMAEIRSELFGEAA